MREAMKREPLHMTIEQAEANEGIMWLVATLPGHFSWKGYEAVFQDVQIKEAAQMHPFDTDFKPAWYDPKEALLLLVTDRIIDKKRPFLQWHTPCYLVEQVEGYADRFSITVEGVVTELSRIARQEDDGECRICGTSINLEVNHFIPRNGAGYESGCAHHQEGLETLCWRCHMKVTAIQRRLLRPTKDERRLAAWKEAQGL